MVYILRLYRDNGKEIETIIGFIWGYIGCYIGIMEEKMENKSILLGFMWGFYWCYIGILENKMETAMQGSVYTGFIWST